MHAISHFNEVAALLHHVALCATRWNMDAIDTGYFIRALDARRLSQRALARLMGVDASAVSLMLRGKRTMRMVEAAQIASLLGLPLTEVIAHAGIQQARGNRVALAGWIDGNGEVHLEPMDDDIEAPQGIPPGCVAVQYRTALTALDHRDGWCLIYQQPSGMDPSCLDRTCVAKLRNGIIVAGKLKRGYRAGRYNIIDPVNLQDVELEWATPVLWIRP